MSPCFQVDIVDLHSCPDDCSIAVETVGTKMSLKNVWLVYHSSLLCLALSGCPAQTFAFEIYSNIFVISDFD